MEQASLSPTSFPGPLPWLLGSFPGPFPEAKGEILGTRLLWAKLLPRVSLLTGEVEERTWKRGCLWAWLKGLVTESANYFCKSQRLKKDQALVIGSKSLAVRRSCLVETVIVTRIFLGQSLGRVMQYPRFSFELFYWSVLLFYTKNVKYKP